MTGQGERGSPIKTDWKCYFWTTTLHFESFSYPGKDSDPGESLQLRVRLDVSRRSFSS